MQIRARTIESPATSQRSSRVPNQLPGSVEVWRKNRKLFTWNAYKKKHKGDKDREDPYFVSITDGDVCPELLGGRAPATHAGDDEARMAQPH